MKAEEVPQDNGMIGEYGHEICYAVDDNGRYILSLSLGWEAKNVVNDQAWMVIAEETRRMHQLVQQGKLSPIAYYQAKHQMDIGLLARYAEIAKWRIKRHRRPEIFWRLPERILQKYATAFGISLTELKTVPATFSPELIRHR
jgi:hypothetical protein